MDKTKDKVLILASIISIVLFILRKVYFNEYYEVNFSELRLNVVLFRTIDLVLNLLLIVFLAIKKTEPIKVISILWLISSMIFSFFILGFKFSSENYSNLLYYVLTVINIGLLVILQKNIEVKEKETKGSLVKYVVIISVIVFLIFIIAPLIKMLAIIFLRELFRPLHWW